MLAISDPKHPFNRELKDVDPRTGQGYAVVPVPGDPGRWVFNRVTNGQSIEVAYIQHHGPIRMFGVYDVQGSYSSRMFPSLQYAADWLRETL